MAKDSSSKTKAAPIQKEQSKEEQKKQAKKEAKAMLAVEKVKTLLEKAQEKLVKAQARVEARTTHLHNLEAKLSAVRTTPPAHEVEAGDSDSDFDHQQGQPEPASAVAPPTSSSRENHASADHADNETTSGHSAPQAEDAPVPSHVQAMEVVAETPDSESNETSSTGMATAKARAPRPGTPGRAPAKPGASSAPARRTTTRKPANKTTPEASDSNKSE
jgi:hypothetical protein